MKNNATYSAVYIVEHDINADLRKRFPQNNIKPHMLKSEVGFDAKDGVYRWTSNDQIPPSECYASHGIDKLPNFDRKKQDAVGERELQAFLTEYREARKNHVPSEEQMYEWRAAFGEGQTIVDVIAGRVYTT